MWHEENFQIYYFLIDWLLTTKFSPLIILITNSITWNLEFHAYYGINYWVVSCLFTDIKIKGSTYSYTYTYIIMCLHDKILILLIRIFRIVKWWEL